MHWSIASSLQACNTATISATARSSVNSPRLLAMAAVADAHPPTDRAPIDCAPTDRAPTDRAPAGRSIAAGNIPGMTPLLKRRMRTLFRIVTALSPALAVRLAARLLITPLARRISDE